jgi:ribonuclease HI
MKAQNSPVLTQPQESLPKNSLRWKFLANQFARLWQFLDQFLEINQEIKATWRRDHRGRSYLEIYDSSTNKHYRFESEQDALIWLDRPR